MDIRTERDARLFTALWAVAEANGRAGAGIRYSREGIARKITSTADDLCRSLAIMNAAPHRYMESTRLDLAEAIEHLRHGFHPYAQPSGR